MSIRVFDFKCLDGHVVEHFIDTSTWREGDAVPCGHVTLGGPLLRCGKPATRQLAAPRAQLEGVTGAFPGAAMQWEKKRESHMAKERQNQEKHGTYK